MGIEDMAVQGVSFLWNRIAGFLAEKQDQQGLLAALGFELSCNIDLLSSVKTEALKDTAISDPAFRGLVESLRTEAAASILFSANRANYRRFARFLASRGELLPLETEAPEEAATIWAALSYAVRKIETLKTLVRIADPASPLFPDFNLSLRINRLRKNLLLLQKAVNNGKGYGD